MGVHTVLSTGSVTERHARYLVLLKEKRHVARGGVCEICKVGRLGVDAKVAEPEVARDDGAHGRVCQCRALLPWQAQAHGIPSVLPIACQVQVFLDPELVEAVVAPGRGGVGVKGPSAGVVAIGVLLDGGGVCGRVGLRVHARVLCHGPRLLAGGGDEDVHGLVGRAHAQAEGVPAAVDAFPVLIGRNRDGSGQVLVIGERRGPEGGGEEHEAGASSVMLEEVHCVSRAPGAGDSYGEATQPREQRRASPLHIARSLRQSSRGWRGEEERDGRQAEVGRPCGSAEEAAGGVEPDCAGVLTGQPSL